MADLTWREIQRALAVRPAARVGEAVAARAAVALILREGPGGIEVLFIRRSEHPQDPWSGQMAFPGGRSEPGDADLRATARRETHEEVGIDLDAAAECLGPLDEVVAMARMRPVDLAIAPFVYRLKEAVEPRPGPEVRSAHWISLPDLLDPRHLSNMDHEHQGSTLRFPCLRVEEIVIWGLTYRMFMGFRDRFAGGGPPADAGEAPGGAGR